MNSRVSNKFVVQTLRYNFRRYLSAQHNVNKITCSYSPVNFNNKTENRFTCYPLSNHLSHKILRHKTASLLFNVQRNVSQKTNVTKDPLESLEKPFPSDNLEYTIINKPPDLTKALESVTTSSPLDIIESFFSLSELQEAWNEGIAQKALETIHQELGLPWWATIGVAALIVRTSFTLPSNIILFRMVAKMEEVEHRMQPIKRELEKDEVEMRLKLGIPSSYNSERHEEALKKEYNHLISKEKCDPIKAMLLMTLQSSTWIASVLSLNRLCTESLEISSNTYEIYDQLAQSEFGWITNLTEPDPFFILPVVYGLLNFAIIKVHRLGKSDPRSNMSQLQITGFSVLAMSLAGASAFAPSGVTIYCISSSFYGLIQALILNKSAIRRLLGVPKFDPEIEAPLQLASDEKQSRPRIASKKRLQIANK